MQFGDDIETIITISEEVNNAIVIGHGVPCL